MAIFSFVFSRNKDDPNDSASCRLFGKRETKDGWMDNVNVADQRLGFMFSWCNEFHSNKPCAFRATRRPTFSEIRKDHSQSRNISLGKPDSFRTEMRHTGKDKGKRRHKQ